MPSAIGSTLSQAINIIIQFWWLWLIIIVVAIAVKLLYKPKEEGFKEFEIPELQDVTKEYLGKYFDLIGISTKTGKIYRSFQQIAGVKKYVAAQGRFDIQYYDPKTKELVTAKHKSKKKETEVETKEKVKLEKKEEEILYDLLFVQAHNKFFLWRILGIKPVYFILRWSNKEGKIQLNFNPMNESIILDSKTDLTMYADAWINCDEGVQYVNNISMIKLNERLMALLNATPDKFTHLEMETAKLKTKLKLQLENEKAKYKEREQAGDTTIV